MTFQKEPRQSVESSINPATDHQWPSFTGWRPCKGISESLISYKRSYSMLLAVAVQKLDVPILSQPSLVIVIHCPVDFWISSQWSSRGLQPLHSPRLCVASWQMLPLGWATSKPGVICWLPLRKKWPVIRLRFTTRPLISWLITITLLWERSVSSTTTPLNSGMAQEAQL